MNSLAWAWNEESSTIVQKYYICYLFQEKSYLSDHFYPLDDYQGQDSKIFPFSITGFLHEICFFVNIQ